MKKLLFFLLLSFVLPVGAVVDKKIDTPTTREILTKVEKAYNKMRKLKADFAQFNSKMKDELHTGTI